jgi:transposase
VARLRANVVHKQVMIGQHTDENAVIKRSSPRSPSGWRASSTASWTKRSMPPCRLRPEEVERLVRLDEPAAASKPKRQPLLAQFPRREIRHRARQHDLQLRLPDEVRRRTRLREAALRTRCVYLERRVRGKWA